MKKVLSIQLVVCIWLMSFPAVAQYKAAFAFDGDKDYIWLDLAGTPLSAPVADFSLDLWFNSRETIWPVSCPDTVRYLFSFKGSGTMRLVLCQNMLYFDLDIPGLSTGLVPLATPHISAFSWNYLTLIKSGQTIKIYLDCAEVYSVTFPGALDLAVFVLGSLSGGNTVPPQEWKGHIDEMRLWDFAIDSADICLYKTCPPVASASHLVAYWTFDEGGPSANNTAIPHVIDFSSNGNNGQFGAPGHPALNGSFSNYVFSHAPVVYPILHGLTLEIRDYPYQMNLLTSILSGDPAHFSLSLNGQPLGPYINVQIIWEASGDGGMNWNTLPPSVFNGINFAVLPGNLLADCSSSTMGFQDRQFRAVVTVTDGALQCTYISNVHELRICCPLTQPVIALSPEGPFCSGDSLMLTVDLSSSNPFVPGASTIVWSFNGIPLPQYNNAVNFTWASPPVSVNAPTNFCFTVQITHSACAQNASATACFTLDPQPICGSIVGNSPNLTILATAPHLVYQICPGQDAAVTVHQFLLFSNANLNWQYTFDNPSTVPSPTWTTLGFSNIAQNTNILPSYLWPAGAASIFYQLVGTALSCTSSCAPCYSNLIEIRLAPSPPKASILGPVEVCLEDMGVGLAIGNVSSGIFYTWLHDGLPIGTGSSLIALAPGCYWVESSNGCEVTTSDLHCLGVCETVAILSCPQPPNPCASPGVPITLTACSSFNTCTGSTDLSYAWSIDGVVDPSLTSCTITHTPASAGTTYTVMVVNSNGCVGTATLKVTPCL